MRAERKESKKKAPWHLWVIAFIFMFLYANSIYDYFMLLSHNEAYYISKGYGAEVHKYFIDYPLLFLALYTVNIISAPISLILMLFRSRRTVYYSFISFTSILLLRILSFAFWNRWVVFGSLISIFDIIFVLLTFGFYCYSRFLKEQSILK